MTTKANLSPLLTRHAETYLGAAKSLSRPVFEDFSAQERFPQELQFRDPIYFLLLHSAELSIKARIHSQGGQPENWHDLIALYGLLRPDTCRVDFKYLRRKIRCHQIEFLEAKWGQFQDSASSAAAAKLEIEVARSVRADPRLTLKGLNRLGEGRGEEKYEFGIKIEKNEWKHAARYPRYGTVRYPNLLDCMTLCEGLIELSKGDCE